MHTLLFYHHFHLEKSTQVFAELIKREFIHEDLHIASYFLFFFVSIVTNCSLFLLSRAKLYHIYEGS